MTGIVTGFSIGKNRNGTKNVVLLQVRLRDTKDIQTVELMTPPGDDSIPPNGARVIILQVSKSYKIAVAQNDDIDPVMDQGEKMIYSQDANKTQKAFIKLLSDGTIEINGNNDFMARFNELKSGFDELRDDHNTFVTTIFNLHNHPTAPVGPVSTPSVTGSSSSASIDNAKVDEVKVI